MAADNPKRLTPEERQEQMATEFLDRFLVPAQDKVRGTILGAYFGDLIDPLLVAFNKRNRTKIGLDDVWHAVSRKLIGIERTTATSRSHPGQAYHPDRSKWEGLKSQVESLQDMHARAEKGFDARYFDVDAVETPGSLAAKIAQLKGKKIQLEEKRQGNRDRGKEQLGMLETRLKENLERQGADVKSFIQSLLPESESTTQ